MSLSFFRIVPFLLAVSAACGDPDPPESCEGLEEGDPAFRRVTFWLQPNRDIDQALVADSVRFWRAQCLRHEPSDQEDKAMARIRVDQGACPVNPETGDITLATASNRGNVTVYAACIAALYPGQPDGRASRTALRAILAHEIGHLAGIWGHIPEACGQPRPDGEFEQSLDAAGICGPALMNSHVEAFYAVITPLDAAAYRLRDPEHASLPSARDSGGGGCILTHRPAP